MQCRICDAASVQEVVPYRNEGRHSDSIFDGLSVSVCGRCESSWVDEPPSNEALAEYYAERYVPVGTRNRAEEAAWPIWDSRPASLIVLARIFAEFGPGDLFVDVGPGNGAALSLAPYFLARPRLACIEFNRETIGFLERVCPGIIVTSSLEMLLKGQGEGCAKMVYSAHCLEHFRADDLERHLREVRRALAPGGVFALEVPCAGVDRMKASNHSPHLVFFTPTGLGKLLERIGFELKLCFISVGRTRSGRAYAKRLLPGPSGEVDRDYLLRIATLNVPDFLPKKPKGSESGVIKCVAVKTDAH